jgi:hypothetical protein
LRAGHAKTKVGIRLLCLLDKTFGVSRNLRERRTDIRTNCVLVYKGLKLHRDLSKLLALLVRRARSGFCGFYMQANVGFS